MALAQGGSILTVTTRHCDFCGKPALEVHYNFTRDPDAAGDTEWNHESVDLCHEHAVKALQDFLQKPLAGTNQVSKEEFSRWVPRSKWKPNVKEAA